MVKKGGRDNAEEGETERRGRRKGGEDEALNSAPWPFYFLKKSKHRLAEAFPFSFFLYM